MTCCPSKNAEIQEKAADLYREEENHRIANAAGKVEAEGYGVLCRMEEIVLFCKKAGYHCLGLVFCMGLHNEARDVNRILIIANPHNPTGRCWTAEELTRVGELCADNGVLLICDEIHADLIMPGSTFCSMGTLSEKIRQNTVFHYAPSKTFNLASLQTSYTVIPNDAIRAKFEKGLTANRIINMNGFGQVALETAYNQCEGYADGLCAYVGANMDYVEQYLKEHLPMLKLRKSEGTYMIWMDFRGTGMTEEEIEHFIIHKAHIGVDLGTWFGPGGEGFLRFNLACPRCLVEKAMQMLTDAMQERK